MVKLMKLFSSSWIWPSCNQQPKTLSFRIDQNEVTVKNPNLTSMDGFFTDFGSFSLASDDDDENDPIEKVIHGLNSDRLFFEPKDTSSIIESPKQPVAAAIAGAASSSASASASASSSDPHTMVLSMGSRNPYVDFKKSMKEMVETYGVNDWERLEELLSCYLKLNDQKNHELIVDAFVDLVAPRAVAAAAESSSSSHFTPNSSSPLSLCSSSMPSSSSTPPCALRLGKIKEDEIMPAEDYPSSSTSKYPKYFRK